MKLHPFPIALLATVLGTAACGGGTGGGADAGDTADAHGGTHTHADGTVHADDHGDPGHDEQPLGTVTIDDMEVTAAQSHGLVEPGKLCHLVVQLPYSDDGATIVRAWIGTADRDLYLVEKGEYAASHDDYDIHVEAPDPLPDDAAWWIEIEQPDGAVATGSIKMLR